MSNMYVKEEVDDDIDSKPGINEAGDGTPKLREMGTRLRKAESRKAQDMSSDCSLRLSAARPSVSQSPRGKATRTSFSPHSTTTPSPPLINPAFSHSTSEVRYFEEDRSPTSVRQLSKIRRFLSTLLHFGTELSPAAGEKVRSLILNLVGGVIGIEEFHQVVRETTNSPLRPFVLPFLKAHLPLLQREIAFFARLAKQTPQQYLRGHESLALDQSYTPSDVADYFTSDPKQDPSGVKRRSSDTLIESPGSDELLTPKRPHIIVNNSNLNSFSRAKDSLTFSRCSPNQSSSTSSTSSPAQHFMNGSSNGEHFLDEEWSNIHTMLGCIQTMVEKTRRALVILQQRTLETPKISPPPTKDLHSFINEVLIQSVRSTEERVAEVKRKAEEAVEEVQRVAVEQLKRVIGDYQPSLERKFDIRYRGESMNGSEARPLHANDRGEDGSSEDGGQSGGNLSKTERSPKS